jgi:hypothetical protein
MSVADRSLGITNEVRTIMTTTAVPPATTQQRGVELLVSRLAVGMLRWSQQRSARRQPTHDEMMLLRQIQKDAATAIDFARITRLG